MNRRWAYRWEEALSHADWWLAGPLFKPIRKIVEALVVAAGPWVLAVMTLALIGKSAEPWVAAEVLEDIRLTVVYAFMIAPMVAAPLGVVAARLLTNTPDFSEDNSAVAAVMLVACGTAGVTAQALSVLVVFGLGLSEPALALTFVALTSTSAMMWTAFIIITAYRLRSHLLLSFAAGMGVTLILCQVTIEVFVSGHLLVWCFTAGIALSFSLCLVPFSFMDLSPTLVWSTISQLWATFRIDWPLPLGAFLAIVGIWADKWIAWAGPEGLVSAAGFFHAPTYDSPLFFAHLAAIPGLAALTIHIEGPARRAMRRFQSVLTNGASLAAAEQAGDVLSASLWRGVHRTVLTQLALSGLLLLLAPMMASLAGLRLDQFLILRTALIGSLLHILFLATSAMLILCNRKLVFLFLQLLFLFTNAAGTAVLTASYGVTALGFAIASAVGGLTATLYVQDTFRRVLQFCFVSGNDALFRRWGAAG